MQSALPQSTQNKLNHYATKNLYEAAFCLCRGMRLAGKESTGGKVMIFFGGKDAHVKALRFYNGGKVEAKAYADSYKQIKDYVFQR